MTNHNLNLVTLDFDELKASLKQFLSGQELFKDYDFDGADLNLLIELLTVNTHKNAFFLNMALSEAFIDSAQLRTSILSHAKELNYTPRSMRSALANVTVNFQAIGESQPYIIQKGQSFSSQVKNQNFIFSIPETITCSSANNTFSFTTDIYEGSYIKDSYVFDTGSLLPLRFKLTNEKIDTDSIVVNVYEDGKTIPDIYRKTTSLLGLNAKSKVYFLQTNAADGNYEILFGDNILGRRPKNGAIIVADYRVTEGKLADGSSVFQINFDPTIPSSQNGELISNLQVVTNNNAKGGATAEDIETTRFYAPRWFQTQERAVVPLDYVVLLKTQFPEINAINVYGGNELIPPQFGKVIVAVDIANVTGLPQSKQDQYYKFIKPRMMLTEFPIFISPQYTYIGIDTIVRYNINVTNETDNRIKTLTLATITDYNTNNLNNFNVVFRYSKFIKSLDDADPAIVSNITNVNLYKKVALTNNVAQNILMDFTVPLKNNLAPLGITHPKLDEKVLSSSLFTYKGELSVMEDDCAGIVRVVKPHDTDYTTITNIGTINYDTGLIQINSFVPDSFEGDFLIIHVKPRDNDISCKQNTILLIEPSQVNIEIQQLKINDVDN